MDDDASPPRRNYSGDGRSVSLRSLGKFSRAAPLVVLMFHANLRAETTRSVPETASTSAEPWTTLLRHMDGEATRSAEGRQAREDEAGEPRDVGARLPVPQPSSEPRLAMPDAPRSSPRPDGPCPDTTPEAPSRCAGAPDRERRQRGRSGRRDARRGRGRARLATRHGRHAPASGSRGSCGEVQAASHPVTGLRVSRNARPQGEARAGSEPLRGSERRQARARLIPSRRRLYPPVASHATRRIEPTIRLAAPERTPCGAAGSGKGGREVAARGWVRSIQGGSIFPPVPFFTFRISLDALLGSCLLRPCLRRLPLHLRARGAQVERREGCRMYGKQRFRPGLGRGGSPTRCDAP